MPRRILVSLVVCLALAQGVFAQSVTLGGSLTITPANDFATTTFQDPWDMNERTDLGWFLHGADSPTSGFASFSFSGGIFPGNYNTSSDPNLYLLDTGFPGTASVGKVGTNFPIDANTYKWFATRMCSSVNSQMVFFWYNNTIYDSTPGNTASVAFGSPTITRAGCAFYIFDLSALPLNQSGSGGWSGLKRVLRYDPVLENRPAAGSINIDWVRLTAVPLFRTITFTSGNWDIYLSSTPNASGELGYVATVNGTTYSLPVGTLAPGDYYVGIRPAGTTGAFSAFSSTAYHVNAPATLAVTAPSEEGSSDDFATTELGNAWDMTAATDIDLFYNITGSGPGGGPAPATINPAETPRGGVITQPVTALFGTSTAGVVSGTPCASHSDPVLYLLHQDRRGLTTRIDPDHYRILTAELGYPNKARDICGGSIARVVWHVAGEARTSENVSEDIVINTRAGANVFDKIIVDMKSLPLEAGAGSPSHTGWNSIGSGIDGFRIDPHEFVNPTSFYVRRVKLAAFETADQSYTIRWLSNQTGGTVRVFYDTDQNSANGKTQIGGAITQSATAGSIVWNTSTLAQDLQFFIYVEYDDGAGSVNGAYSRWPVVIDHGLPPVRISLDRTLLNFGIVGNFRTPAQTVRVTITGASNPSAYCWTPSSNLPSMVVTGSGCGNGTFTVSTTQPPNSGTGSAIIRVTAAGVSNSPQSVQAWYRATGVSSRPRGTIDTPANGITVTGSVGFTGWSVDDIGVSHVTICRDPIGAERPPADPRCGNAPQIYLGDAVQIDDARPDVAASNSTTPFNYRAGWGFLVLTNMLPNRGNGTFNFYVRAFDIEGGFTLLGLRTLVANNANATQPFGAIDTPGQGEVISGTAYVNFGWVLAAPGKSIPSGSSISVVVDGVSIGSPSYGFHRADIESLFPCPTYTNSCSGPIGHLTINTTAYSNGVHQIAWGVVDSAGVANGIGSRYFTIFNTGSNLTVGNITPGADLGRVAADLARVPDDRQAIGVQRGFNPRAAVVDVVPGVGSVRTVWHEERDRVEVRLAGAEHAARFEGYQIIDGRLAPLPVGSTMNAASGRFAWQPGIGYIGPYEFLFVRTDRDGRRTQTPVRVVLQPHVASHQRAALGPLFRTLFATN